MAAQHKFGSFICKLSDLLTKKDVERVARAIGVNGQALDRMDDGYALFDWMTRHKHPTQGCFYLSESNVLPLASVLSSLNVGGQQAMELIAVYAKAIGQTVTLPQQPTTLVLGAGGGPTTINIGTQPSAAPTPTPPRSVAERRQMLLHERRQEDRIRHQRRAATRRAWDREDKERIERRQREDREHKEIEEAIAKEEAATRRMEEEEQVRRLLKESEKRERERRVREVIAASRSHDA